MAKYSRKESSPEISRVAGMGTWQVKNVLVQIHASTGIWKRPARQSSLPKWFFQHFQAIVR
jgi:hypothetical protein